MNVIQANNLTPAQVRYNERVRSTRQLVERTIGLLKVRFRCILGERQLRYHQTKASNIIYSCAFLHNYLILNGFDIMNDIDEFQLRVVINNNNGMNVNAPLDRREGEVRRTAIVNWLAQQN